MRRKLGTPRTRAPRATEEPTERTSSRSTQGWGAVAKRQAEVAEAKESAENAVRDFWLKDGESAIIQFMQDEPFCFDAHNVRDSRGYWKIVPCQLNTQKHCILCSSGSKQSWRAAFILVDYRGTWNKERNSFNYDTQIPKMWRVGATIAQQLKHQIDRRGTDLTNLVFEVSRSGSGKDTTYNFEPAFDEDDRKLKPMAIDLADTPTAEELCQPPTEDEIDAMGIVID